MVSVLNRRDETVKLREAGSSYAEIGRRLGVTRERVRQIVYKGGEAKVNKVKNLCRTLVALVEFPFVYRRLWGQAMRAITLRALPPLEGA